MVSPSSGSSTGPNVAYVSTHVSELQRVHTFLMSLTNAVTDGRVIVSRTEGKCIYRQCMKLTHSAGGVPQLKFLLLNPWIAFQDVVNEVCPYVQIDFKLPNTY